MGNDNYTKIRRGLGEQLRKAREKARFTQAEVATFAGVNVSYYAQIERGEVNTTFEKLHDIAKVLKIKSLDM